MSEEIEDSGEANGAFGRFDGLDLLYKDGGVPRGRPESVGCALDVVLNYWSTRVNDGDMTTLQLVHELKAAKVAKEAADIVAKELGKRYDFLRLIVIPGAFESDGIEALKVDGVGRVGLRGEIYASINKEHKDEAFQWLDDTGRGALIQKTVNAATLKASLKKMLKDGEEVPEELFKVTPFSMAVITK